MGLDYSIDLYFRIEDLETALLETAKIAAYKPDKLMDVTLANERVIQLPFTTNWRNTDPVEIRQGQFLRFDTSILFPAEPDIRAYREDLEPLLIEGREYIGIGYIYLSIRLGEYFVGLSFAAATTSMSLLFLNSKTVHQRFLDLLEAASGVLGLIDVEEGGYQLLHQPEKTAIYAHASHPHARYNANSGFDPLVDAVLWAKENWE